MNLFGKDPDPTLERLVAEVEKLSKRVAELKGEREELGLAGKIATLQREKTEKEIGLDRVLEDHERERREIEHKIGLHRQRVEQEIELSRKEAVLDVRQENLDKDRERFEHEIEYTRKRFSEEVDRLTSLQKEILDRLPTWNVDRQIKETIGAGANGDGDES